MMRIIFSFIVFFILFAAFVRCLESASLFYPDKLIRVTPQGIGLEFEDVYFPTRDNVILNGWFIPGEGADATLIFLHGNAGNMGDRLGKIQFFHDMGLNIFIVDYRGFGKSQGRPTERGMYLDAQAGYDYLLTRDDIDHDKIVGYGASLGGAAVVDLATKRSLHSFIIDSSFSSGVDMAREIYPFIPSFLISVKLDSITKIKDITIPKLFIHSINDEIVPYYLGKKLYDAAGEPKRFLEIKGTHNEGHATDEQSFVGGIREFLAQWGLVS